MIDRTTSPRPTRFAAVLAFLQARPTLLFALIALIVPNLFYLLAVAAGIGTPIRSGAILSYLVVALLARSVPMGVFISLYLVVLAYDLAHTVSRLFGLSFLEIVMVMRFIGEVRLYASQFYVGAGLAIAVTCVATIWLLVTQRHHLPRARLAPPVAGALALVAVDLSVNSLPQYQFGRTMAFGQPFESALQDSGLESDTSALLASPARPNVLIVMVEGLGVFSDGALQAIMTEPVMGADVAERYAVTSGQVTYYGSTTAAEMRELCANREHFETMLETTDEACLPARMARVGYRTIAYHGFSKDMFERDKWYPNIGFQKAIFGEDMYFQHLPICGMAFRGICDTAVANIVKSVMTGAREPTFMYWLTLNTHVPIIEGEHSGYLACGDGNPFGSRLVCDLAGMWRDIFGAVAGIALAEGLPPTEILIIGDHAPPLWSRKQRTQFDPGRVPWIRLSPRT